MSTVRFGRDDLELFSAASHDSNPLHMSPAYARKTAYGEPVVFGILGTLAALGFLPERQGAGLAGVSVMFRNPLFVGVDYEVEVTEISGAQVVLSVNDAGRLMLSATLLFRPGGNDPGVGDVPGTATVAEPARHTAEDLGEGLSVGGVYAPPPAPLRKLIDRWRLEGKGASASQVAALLWTSYLVGMRLPGERAIFSRLQLTFPDGDPPSGAPFRYEATLAKFDRRFDMIKAVARLSGPGGTAADAELWSFVRPDSPPLSPEAVAASLPRSEALRGRAALVVGGSRGLGASLVYALASQGCDVLLNYRSSAAAAEALREKLRGEPGSVTLAPGDASDADLCRELRREAVGRFGGLDALVCNASPPLHATGFGLDAMGRFRKFVDEALSLAAVPLAAFLGALEDRRGWGVVISSAVSSAASETYPPDWVHYVAAKYAIEGTVRAVAAQSKRARFLLVRPPRLLTDMTNTPTGRQGAVPVEGVAAAVVGRLCDPDADRRLEVLESF